MLLNSGDLVFPSDLPRRFLCRVEDIDTIGLESGPFQIMTLAPLEGPWTPSTRLVRTNQTVLVPSRGDVSRKAFSRPARAQRVVRQRRRSLRHAS